MKRWFKRFWLSWYLPMAVLYDHTTDKWTVAAWPFCSVTFTYHHTLADAFNWCDDRGLDVWWVYDGEGRCIPGP